MKLVISLATRNRPEQVVDTIKRSVANWTHPETVMQVQLDHDDPAPYDYLKAAKISDRVLLNVQPREATVAAKWNRALKLDADVYSVAADDDPYVVPGYDTMILEAAKRFPDGIGMVYGAMANLSFTGSLSMTRGLADKLGYIQPEYFPYWFCDHWTDDVAKMIGRISYADLRTDQSRAGRTQEMREPAWWATWFDACFLIRRREARKIIDSSDFASEEWQKELLRTGYPLIEQRSRILNGSVRHQAQAGQLPITWDQDDRYKALRAKAVAMLPGILWDPEMSDGDRAAFTNMLIPPTTIPSLKQAFA